MHRNKILLSLVLITVGSLSAQTRSGSASAFSGRSALEFTKRAVAFGPRPAGSEENRKLRAWIISELRRYRCEVSEDAFTASAPVGRVPMANIIARFRGTSGRSVAITGHYDTKAMPGRYFVGANDGGSSTGFLLEMARVLSAQPRRYDIYLVWFDGEEAFAQWSDSDSLYGSRHLAERWSRDGTLSKMNALINVDMIGDRDLGIMPELNSSEDLRDLAWSTARQSGYGKYFLEQVGAVEDDHIPFLRHGVRALDLIDFSYGPNNSWWHTEQDTMDKLSANSFEVVGRVVLAMLKKL